MQKRLISTCILIVYSAILIKVMVFKDVPLIRIGSLMLNFGGTNTGYQPNFVPFKTILPYLLGSKGLIIAGINLVGNVALLIPLGFLFSFVFRNMTWKKSLVLAVVAGLVIEIMQIVLRVGIFDIDDVILNAFGVMIGYGTFALFSKWARSRKYKNIIIAAIIVIAAVSAFYGVVVYPITHQSVNPAIGAGSDLCGGTGGTGQIVSVGSNTFTLKRNDGRIHIVTLTNQTVIKTTAGSASRSDLKIGDRVTLVGGPNSDGSFTADTIVVCSVPGSEN